MEEILMHISLMDKSSNFVLDIENLTQLSDKCCSGNPKVMRILSRKGSCRIERHDGEEEGESENSQKFVINVITSELENLEQQLAAGPSVSNNPMLVDYGDGRNKKTIRRTTVHPRKILLFFATMSSMGPMILIYFTLAINRRGGS